MSDIGQYSEDTLRFLTDEGATYVIRSMRYAGENEVRYIRDYWQQFENAIKSPNGVNDEGKNYSEYIDLDSVCRQFLQFELYGEISLKASIYFYKDADANGDGKIHAVYPWDVEHSMCQEGFGIYGENAEQNMHHWENIKNRAELKNTMWQIWSNEMKPIIVDFFGTPLKNGDSDAARLFKKYSDDFKINNYRWQEDDAEVKYEEIKSFMTNRVKYMDDTFTVY